MFILLHFAGKKFIPSFAAMTYSFRLFNTEEIAKLQYEKYMLSLKKKMCGQ